MTSKIRSLVSKKKLRFKQDGFDLDLSYVTPRLIAMGFPSENFEGMYRNKMSEVKKFFLHFHEGHYKVYNLCSERSYSANHFKNATASFPFDDHNPCAFETLIKFCEDAAVYLDADRKNTIAVHCKAGKGRTGLVLCCFMQYTGQNSSPEEAMTEYGNARTQNGKGVTIPSQIRWVQYFGAYLKYYRNASPPRELRVGGIPLLISGVILNGFPNIDGATSLNLHFKIETMKKTTMYAGKGTKEGVKNWKKSDRPNLLFTLDPPIHVCGDIHFTFYSNGRFNKDNKLFGFWLHTSFMDSSPTSNNADNALNVPKREIDKCVKDVKNKEYPEDFSVTLNYRAAEAAIAAEVAHKKDVLEKEPDFTGLGSATEGEDKVKPLEDSGKVYFNPLRRLVSKKKLRFQKDGFDLDLSYISPTIIAMGFPSISFEGFYRNKMSDVQKMLNKYHHEHYKVYNLCSERTYTPDYFENNTASFPFDDHNPCPLQMLFRFCEHAYSYQQDDKLNTIAIHCKAGKGRTGLMISTLLMHDSTCKTADEALRYYGERRTSNVKGVTIPSQQRYVKYYEEFLYNYHFIQKPFDFHGHNLTFCGVYLNPVINIDMGGGCTPSFKIFLMDRTVVYNSRSAEKDVHDAGKATGHKWKKDGWGFQCKLPLRGDIHIVFYSDDSFGKVNKMFGLWLHTSFIHSRSITFDKSELDRANKDKKFPKDFRCQLFFENFSPQPDAQATRGRRTTVHVEGNETIAEKFDKSKIDHSTTQPDVQDPNLGVIMEDEEVSSASDDELSEDEYVEGGEEPEDHDADEKGERQPVDLSVFEDIGVPEAKKALETLRIDLSESSAGLGPRDSLLGDIDVSIPLMNFGSEDFSFGDISLDDTRLSLTAPSSANLTLEKPSLDGINENEQSSTGVPEVEVDDTLKIEDIPRTRRRTTSNAQLVHDTPPTQAPQATGATGAAEDSAVFVQELLELAFTQKDRIGTLNTKLSDDSISEEEKAKLEQEIADCKALIQSTLSKLTDAKKRDENWLKLTKVAAANGESVADLSQLSDDTEIQKVLVDTYNFAEGDCANLITRIKKAATLTAL